MTWIPNLHPRGFSIDWIHRSMYCLNLRSLLVLFFPSLKSQSLQVRKSHQMNSRMSSWLCLLRAVRSHWTILSTGVLWIVWHFQNMTLLLWAKWVRNRQSGFRKTTFEALEVFQGRDYFVIQAKYCIYLSILDLRAIFPGKLSSSSQGHAMGGGIHGKGRREEYSQLNPSPVLASVISPSAPWGIAPKRVGNPAKKEAEPKIGSEFQMLPTACQRSWIIYVYKYNCVSQLCEGINGK